MAHASVKMEEVDKLQVTIITDNYYDCLRWNYKIANRHHKFPDASIWKGWRFHAEHGLSYYIETVVNGKSNAFMLDYGMDFEGVTKNMEILGIDVNKLEAFGLSHGHLDHWGNLIPILEANRNKIRKGVPLYVGEDAFDNKFAKLPPRLYAPNEGLSDLGQLDRGRIESIDRVKIIQVKDPTPIVPGAYMTGNIERVTDYEKGSPILLVKKGDRMERDYFQGEQSLMFNVKGKGLVVLSSCAHSGIVNTVKHAQKVTGIDKVHAVMGGFHLTGAKPEVIQRTIADIKAVKPDYIVPMHCSGFEAITGFSIAMPDQFIINVAGTTYTFGA